MDCASRKFYHKHEFDCRDFLEKYCADKPDMEFAEDALQFPTMSFHYVFSSGFVKGDVLIDISMGPLIHHLYSACDIFKDIIILKLNEGCNMETSRWANTRTGAFEWRHTSAYVSKLEGKSAQIQDKEMKLKEAISHIICCDFENENITHPVVLPLADCITSIWILDAISKDEDEYMKNLEKVSKLLRPGGHLILIAALNTTFFMTGGERIYILKHDANFVINALSKVGFVIEYYAVQMRRNDSTLIDYEGVMFFTFRKTK
ncbi:nicotinamide N-methyltransferase-like [Hyperolius riggenbachi]|uniref:nicotinamide N-methyltransferase-like n=1 Tax=Hyperolius riggenbachi TaxID=752182 RepID=UPI0035A2C759